MLLHPLRDRSRPGAPFPVLAAFIQRVFFEFLPGFIRWVFVLCAMSANYCSNCGEELAADATFCSECGTEVSEGGQDSEPSPNDSVADSTPQAGPRSSESSSGTGAPIWTVAALGVLWVIFLVTFPGLENTGQASGMAALSGLSVLASIPLLYVDARKAKRAGVLEARPILVVIAVFILYLVTMPVYVGYRVYKDRKSD